MTEGRGKIMMDQKYIIYHIFPLQGMIKGESGWND